LDKLQDFNTVLLPTEEKLLACGDYGIGGLVDKKVIIETILKDE